MFVVPVKSTGTYHVFPLTQEFTTFVNVGAVAGVGARHASLELN